MKLFFLILFLLLPGFTFAGKGYLLTFVVKSVESKKKIPGITVKCFNKQHELLHEGKTDKKGEFNWVGTEESYLWIEFTDPTLAHVAYTKIITNKKLDRISEFVFLTARLQADLAAFQKATAVSMKNDTVRETVRECTDDLVLAHFDGGERQLHQFIADSISHPDITYLEGSSWTVEVTFLISTNGSVRELTVSKSVSPQLDEEAMLVVAKMPAWDPATCNNQKIASYYTLPINFRTP